MLGAGDAQEVARLQNQRKLLTIAEENDYCDPFLFAPEDISDLGVSPDSSLPQLQAKSESDTSAR
ncbi:MAG: hypothetical protein WCA15_14030 [Candidatus Acidiferrales bacterium]